MAKKQNFSNHVRLVPMYHFVLFTIVLAINVFAIVNFITTFQGQNAFIPAVLFELISLYILFSFVIFRVFSLKAQDRAIRAEENLRYYALTGKLMDSRLTLSQIIALRFAPDDELVELALRTLKENLSNKAIKQAIINWREDFHRV